jgi:hypothetical protein
MRGLEPGAWFAIPLRFALFAVGRAAAVDASGMLLGYFFGRFFERLPAGPEMLAFSPGDAEIIGVCDGHGLRSGEWRFIAAARPFDPRPWPIPVFRTFDAERSALRWSTFDPTNFRHAVAFDREPADAGARNWGLPMNALQPEPMSPAEVEAELFRRFRAHQNALHRKYIADLQRSIAARAS